MQKLINRFGYKKVNYVMIALVLVLTIIFVTSIVFAVKYYIELTSITNITM